MCLECGRGFHDECDNDPCCCATSNSDSGSGTEEGNTEATPDRNRFSKSNVGISAGRKRAAVEYDIDPGAPCEWRGQTNCGGGFKPVTGCIIGFQIDRHHGPDKNTTNNTRENIHLICKPCHNLWHRRNDPDYGPDKCPEGIQPHEPRWATELELMTKESAS
jgi:hypothetical protein